MAENPSFTRRHFLGAAVATAGALSAGVDLLGQTSAPGETGLPTRPLGKSGVRLPVLALGGWHIGAIPEEDQAIRIIQTAVDEGMAFIDSAWCYHNGRSEERQGKALAEGGRRQKTFVMTKLCDRTYEGAMKNLDDSLRRLKTDYIDLWQVHHICHANSADLAYEQGAVRAALEAKQSGKVRFIGFTGHNQPWQVLRMLGRDVQFDTAQFPVNPLDPLYASYIRNVMPACLRENVSILAMKTMANGRLPKYMPAESCMRYALSHPVVAQAIGIRTMEELTQALENARRFKPMTETEQVELVASVKELAEGGPNEPYKSTHKGDTPFHCRQDGYEQTEAVREQPPA